jgi:hypothetical protein
MFSSLQKAFPCSAMGGVEGDGLQCWAESQHCSHLLFYFTQKLKPIGRHVSFPVEHKQQLIGKTKQQNLHYCNLGTKADMGNRCGGAKDCDIQDLESLTMLLTANCNLARLESKLYFLNVKEHISFFIFTFFVNECFCSLEWHYPKIATQQLYSYLPEGLLLVIAIWWT